MGKKEFFGYTPDQLVDIFKHAERDVDPEHVSGQINPRAETISPCIEGSKKIERNPELRAVMKCIYGK